VLEITEVLVCSTHAQKGIQMSKEQELRVAIQIYLYWMNTAKEKREGSEGRKKQCLKQPRRNSRLPCTFVN
jgi:hypothetical protein